MDEEVEDGVMLSSELVQLDVVTEQAPCVLLEVGGLFTTLMFDTPEHARAAWEALKFVTEIETD